VDAAAADGGMTEIALVVVVVENATSVRNKSMIVSRHCVASVWNVRWQRESRSREGLES
jgi:hypothetical protein